MLVVRKIFGASSPGSSLVTSHVLCSLQLQFPSVPSHEDVAGAGLKIRFTKLEVPGCLRTRSEDKRHRTTPNAKNWMRGSHSLVTSACRFTSKPDIQYHPSRGVCVVGDAALHQILTLHRCFGLVLRDDCPLAHSPRKSQQCELSAGSAKQFVTLRAVCTVPAPLPEHRSRVELFEITANNKPIISCAKSDKSNHVNRLESASPHHTECKDRSK